MSMKICNTKSGNNQTKISLSGQKKISLVIGYQCKTYASSNLKWWSSEAGKNCTEKLIIKTMLQNNTPANHSVSSSECNNIHHQVSCAVHCAECLFFHPWERIQGGMRNHMNPFAWVGLNYRTTRGWGLYCHHTWNKCSMNSVCKTYLPG